MAKRVIIFAIIISFLMSCEKQVFNENVFLSNDYMAKEVTKASSAIVSSESFFHPELMKWLIEEDDPFELSRYQKAFTKAAEAIGKKSSIRANLSATHFALKVIPSSFKEQEMLERDSDLSISYIPFGYVLAPAPAPRQNLISRGVSVEEFECGYGEEGPEIEPKILYIIWPASKEIPSSLTYEKKYDVFLPEFADLTQDEKVIASLLRMYGDDISRGQLDPFFPRIPDAVLTVKVYDNLLDNYIPLKNVKIKAEFGSATAYYTTDSLGKARVARMYGDHATCSYVLQQNKFSVRDSTSSAVVERSLGYVQIGDMSTPPFYHDTYYTYNLAEDFPEIVYNAADYLFNEDALADPDIVNIPAINIFLLPEGPGFNGRYQPNGRYIEIRNNNQHARNNVIGTTLHELGHYYQHYNWNYNDSSVDTLLTQSFAFGFGYYLGEEYYLSKGFVKPNNSYHINGQHCQDWSYITGRSSSPIYVDLIDNYNQYISGSSKPNDTLAGIPFSIILRMGKEAESLEDVEYILNEELTPNYTSSQIASQLVYYYYWRSHQ